MGQKEWQDTGDKHEESEIWEGIFTLGRVKEVNTEGEEENNNKDV